MKSSPESLIREKLKAVDREALEPFLSRLEQGPGAKADAVLAYGSCLSPITRSATSIPDFFLLVRSYRAFYGSRWPAFLNRVLPPNIYHFTVDGRTAKFNVVDHRTLARGTALRARDVYLLGRFSKRMAAPGIRNEQALEDVVRAQARAMRAIAARTYPLMSPGFTPEAFALRCLRLSYEGDVRVEAEDKVQRLFEAERDHYLACYETILKEMQAESFSPFCGRIRTWGFLAYSRIKAQLRWPKNMLTVENWLEYLLGKIERTHGIKIRMSPRERRFWFIYGWKHFFALRRKKLIK